VDVLADRYELREKIGAGAMATVWKGWDTRLHRFVAIKILDRGLGADPGFVARFEREARHAGSLNHPNIVTIFDFGTEFEMSYLVMELVEGESVATLLRRVGTLGPPETVEICLGVLSGLEAAHHYEIVHRDIKPSNILLGRNVVKVADFGIARSSGEVTSLTEAGVLIGTVSYLSPEQCVGERATARSDVYAVGCLAYQCLTGAPPFTGENAASVMYQHQYALPVPVVERRPDIAPSLSRAIDRALAKDPAQRFSSAAEMQIALRTTAQPHEPTVPIVINGSDPDQTVRLGTSRIPVQSVSSTPNKGHGRRRTAAIMAFVVVALLIAGGVTAGLIARHNRQSSVATLDKQSGRVLSPAISAGPTTTSGPSTSAPAPSAISSLSVHECPSSYGDQQTPTSRIPRSITVALSASEADRLAFYSDSTRSVDPVLAPVGWSCSANVGADGSTILSVFPSGQSDPGQSSGAWPATTQGVIAYSPSACQDCVAGLVCPLFPNAEDQLGYSDQSCSSEAPEEEQTTFLAGSSTADYGTVELTDPAGVQGTVQMSGGSYEALGIMRYDDSQGQGQAATESCVLRKDESTLCSAITHDFVHRGWGFDS
jgi:serine/threonine protein kinase